MEQRVNMMDVLKALVAGRRLIAFSTAAAVAVAVVVSLLLPQWYKSRATVLPPESSASQLDVIGIMQFAGYQPGLIPTLSSPSEVYAAIMGSIRIKLAVIDSLDLAAVYDESRPEKLLADLGKHTWITVTSEGIVIVECEDKEPVRAKRLVDTYVSELDRFNRFSKVTSAKAVRQFIEVRIAQVVEELNAAENELKAFKDSTGAVLISEQSRVSIETAAEIFARIAELEVQRARLRLFATDRSPEIVDINRQIAALERKLEEMGYRKSGSPVERESTLFPKFSDAPELELNLARLMRDVEVKRAVYQVLSEQYEQAKIQEMKDTPTVQVLDWGHVPTLRYRPKRKVIVLVTAVAALLVSSVVAVVRQRVRRGEYAPEREALAEIRDSLAADVKDARKFLKGD
jgi:tyrosine-protein kinase Etk/Wzc